MSILNFSVYLQLCLSEDIGIFILWHYLFFHPMSGSILMIWVNLAPPTCVYHVNMSHLYTIRLQHFNGTNPRHLHDLSRHLTLYWLMVDFIVINWYLFFTPWRVKVACNSSLVAYIWHWPNNTMVSRINFREFSICITYFQ